MINAIRLNRHEMTELVELFSPIFDSKKERKWYLQIALGQITILELLDYDNKTPAFVVELIERLLQYGDLEENEPALCILLKYVRTLVGLDRKEEINKLILLVKEKTRQQESKKQTKKSESIIDIDIPEAYDGKKIDLRRRALKDWPKEIMRDSDVVSLDLSFNQMTALPTLVKELKKLRELRLCRNQLQDLPSEIGELTSLSVLDLTGNNLELLPAEVEKLKALRELYLYNNHLKSLPSEISQLTNLNILDLSSNLLHAIPKEIEQLEHLEYLYLNDNNISALPVEISKLTKLKDLQLYGNPLLSPPSEIVSQGMQAIIEYFQKQLQDSQQQWMTKLTIVGEGGVGKTSLLRALCRESFESLSPTTHGINLKALEFKHPFKDDVIIKLNAWDFGGQEIYHATHQFFLTNHSLCLLVWNARHGYEQGKLYYWLDTIQAISPKSSVLIVPTHIDEREADFPYNDLCEHYPQIKGWCGVSNFDGRGIEELQKKIADHVASLPFVGEVWPASWINVTTAIRSISDNSLSPRQLYDLMNSFGISGEDVELLLQRLHDLGDILYFRDDAGLSDIVITKPQWITEYISKVLESEEVIRKAGIFTQEHMNELWYDIDEVTQFYLLRLMERFDLSYRTLENKEVSLVVERLSLDPPAEYQEIWEKHKENGKGHEITMKFYFNTIPAGIPTWFIARSHRFTTHIHWRNGAILTDRLDTRKHLARILVFHHARYLELTVHGPNPHNFFALLKDGVEVTLKRFPGLKIERKIPCTGHNGKPCNYEYNYEALQKALENGHQEVQCPISFESISLPKLLFGLHWSPDNVVMSRIDSINTQILVDKQSDLLDELKDLRALVQREFLKTFEYEQTQLHCPDLFILRPANSKTWSENIFNSEMEIQLYCQAPGEWHPALEGGRYQTQLTTQWFANMKSYIQKMFNVLKYISPQPGPWIGTVSKNDYAEMLKNDLQLMNELVKRLKSTKELHESSLQNNSLASLHQLLNDVDPQKYWGNLIRILTPEGHYLWLCDYHAQQYLST